MTGTTINAIDRIPFFVLRQVADDLDLPRIDIANFRSLYQWRERTLFEHQQWAMQLLGIDAFNDHHQRALMRAFRPLVSKAYQDVGQMQMYVNYEDSIKTLRWQLAQAIAEIFLRSVHAVARVKRRENSTLS